eukprot:g6981.t1
MKKMVNAKYTIQTSKDDMKSLYDLIRRFQQLQAKKMYWIYKYHESDSITLHPMMVQNRQLLSKQVVPSIKREIKIILGIKTEHDDETLRSMNLLNPRSPEEWWKTDIFGTSIAFRIERHCHRICAQFKNETFLNKEAKKLPIFVHINGIQFAKDMMHKAIQQMKTASVDDVKKALTAYLLDNRFITVTRYISAYVDEEGSIHQLSSEQQKYLGNIFLIVATRAIDTCIAKLNAKLKERLDGYEHFNLEPSKQNNVGKHATALRTLIIAPVAKAVQYTASTVQCMYYACVEECILGIPQTMSQCLLQNAGTV